MKAEDVMEWAEVTALFFRRLVGEGIPADAAVKMTCAFVSSLVLVPDVEEPTEPWGDTD